MLPRFDTRRLALRPRTMADFDACWTMDRDPEVTKFVVGPWDDPKAHEAFLRERIQRSLGPGMGYWSIFPKANPKDFLGWVALIPYDGVGPAIEIGWRLRRALWGKGYATEAVLPLVPYALETLRLERLVAAINSENRASIRVAEKIGMTCAGDGTFAGLPCKNYVLTAADYKRSQREEGAVPLDPATPG